MPSWRVRACAVSQSACHDEHIGRRSEGYENLVVDPDPRRRGGRRLGVCDHNAQRKIDPVPAPGLRPLWSFPHAPYPSDPP